jgi:hypothetical protein
VAASPVSVVVARVGGATRKDAAPTPTAHFKNRENLIFNLTESSIYAPPGGPSRNEAPFTGFF